MTVYRLARIRLDQSSFRLFALAAAALGPAIFWSFVTKGDDIRYRVFPVSFPALAVIAGYALTACARAISARLSIDSRKAVLAATVIILLTGAVNARGLLQARSGYREAASKLVEHVAIRGGDIGFWPGSIWPVWNFYLSAEYEAASTELRKSIRFYAQKQDSEPVGTFEPVDFWRYYRSFRIDDRELRAHFASIGQSRQAVVRVPNPFVEYSGLVFEAGGKSVRESLDQVTAIPGSDEIIIYDLTADATFASRVEETHENSR